MSGISDVSQEIVDMDGETVVVTTPPNPETLWSATSRACRWGQIDLTSDELETITGHVVRALDNRHRSQLLPRAVCKGE